VTTPTPTAKIQPASRPALTDATTHDPNTIAAPMPATMAVGTASDRPGETSTFPVAPSPTPVATAATRAAHLALGLELGRSSADVGSNTWTMHQSY